MNESENEVAQSCPTLSDPMDCSPPGFSVHGSFQARVLEWVASAFSFQLLRDLIYDLTLMALDKGDSLGCGQGVNWDYCHCQT